MQLFIRSTLCALVLLIAATGAGAQQETKEPTASITGRVTVGGKAAQGVIVLLTRVDADAMGTIAAILGHKSSAKTTTDEEGGYRFANLAAGRYLLNPFGPALVIPSESWPPGKTINIGNGETVEKVDFALTRGGVITGRILDARGRPVVGQIVTLTPVEEGDRKPQQFDPLAASPFGKSMYMTDDRGIYRLYGLNAGRYLVSLGVANIGINLNPKRSYQAQTFHPGVTDKSKAAIVEIKEGSEATGIDIRLGLPSKTYNVSGRIIDGDTGKPLSAIVANYGTVSGEAKMVMPGGLGAIANSKGEFRLDSIVPGRYHAFASFDQDSESYSDSTPFEITNGDVTGLVVKVHRGLSISGIVSIEGTDDPAMLASLTQIQLNAYVLAAEATAPREFTAKIAPDGTFRMTGLQPGTINFYVNRFFVPTKLTVLRIERAGVAQQTGLRINPGESLTDVRVVLAKATGELRGQIKLSGNVSLEDVNLAVSVRRAGQDGARAYQTTEVDANGRFTFEQLLAGEYEISVKATNLNDKKSVTATQNVSVSGEAEATVTLTIDLSKKNDEDK
ncbi:MAG: hypothetical protein WBV94_30200 [Blastocatellia bacterium]